VERLTSDDKLRCPNCGGADIRHSLRRGILDWLMNVFDKAPFRCRRCERRFYRRVAVREPVEAEAETPATDTEQ
jgi:DNA-directed RNA polymerase subunit RPC12/RpoP